MAASPNINESLSLTHTLVAVTGGTTSASSPKVISTTGRIMQTGNTVAAGVQPVTETAVAINISTLNGPLGRFAIKNLDTVYNLQILTALTGGQPIITLLPGEHAQARFDSAITAPAVVAVVGAGGTGPAAVMMEYVICEA
jgi:hypothetical protein